MYSASVSSLFMSFVSRLVLHSAVDSSIRVILRQAVVFTSISVFAPTNALFFVRSLVDSPSIRDFLFQPEVSWEARTEVDACAPLIRNVVDKSYVEDKQRGSKESTIGAASRKVDC